MIRVAPDSLATLVLERSAAGKRWIWKRLKETNSAMTHNAAIDLDKAMLDPNAVFRAPKDVLGVPGLSCQDKKEILIRWEDDAAALLRATEEGMLPAGNRSPAELLRAVHAAMQSLSCDRANAA
jgi:hypothetical protein